MKFGQYAALGAGFGATLCAVFFGCGGTTGTESRADAKAMQGGTVAGGIALPALVPGDAGPAVGTLPPLANDPGPTRPALCSAGDRLSFLMVENFEPDMPGSPGTAISWYFYGDNTPGSVVAYPLLNGWQPPTTPIPWASGRCGSEYALHLAGGTYQRFGMGFGTSIAPHAPAQPALLPLLQTVAQSNDNPPQPRQVADLSGYSGVSFWARRGPSGQSGLTIAVIDQSISDDVNRLLPLDRAACRSQYTSCGCSNGKPCSSYVPDSSAGSSAPPAGTYCFDPSANSIPPDPRLTCGQFACDGNPPPLATLPNHVQDDAGTLPCTPFTSKSSGVTNSYCYNAGSDPDPPDPTETCGDAYSASVSLTGDWKLFTVAFGELRQGGYGKPSREIDTSAIYGVQFTLGSGNVDVWIDDIAFYVPN